MPKLWAITVYVYSIADAVKFYGGILGFDVVENDEARGMAVFDLGGIPFLTRVPEAGEEWKRPGGGANLFIEVDNLEEVLNRIQAAGLGQVVYGPEESSPNHYNAGVQDPFGNELVLTHKSAQSES
jgi:predicted enzyme related to lactoylglutathione lyase